ncbi:hypothetical protein CHS0354_033459 [Potamilus streckersoni]|uniref:ATP-dependent RNA helicase n=1 Tax=Potamilus streckersoni TaxID=2493646 RepID=A0AAE0SGF3_9BIVA|nr:hypothetical protein CHS0354_033459 [Potamilus streckersoni]
MTQETEDDIQLNINIGGDHLFLEAKERRGAVRGNRRIKVRRTGNLKASENLEHKHSGGSEKKTNVISQEVKFTEQQHHRNIHHAVGKTADPLSTGVISSLFKNNPEIPKIDRMKVDTVKEEVFSTKFLQDLPLHPFMISSLTQQGFSQLTTVQMMAIPHLLLGRDALIKSQTGSGKTLAYSIPIIQRLQEITPHTKRTDGPLAVIIVPTRELALQSFETFQKLVKPFSWIVPGCLTGGEKRKAEKARIRKGINILVCTPGRLIDHIQHTNSLTLDKVKYLVLDEADRLLELGYEKDVSQIVAALHQQEHHQTVLLSATLSPGVEWLAGMSLQNPERIYASPEESSRNKKDDFVAQESKSDFVIPVNLKQHFVITPCKLRLVTLISFLLGKQKSKGKPCKMIVFLSTQDSVQFHYMLLKFLSSTTISNDKNDVNVDDLSQFQIFQLHGQMDHKERTAAFQKFSKTCSGVLLCTDVASRGLDLPKVEWIVQYTTLGSTTDYIHRVGRTARVGSMGNALLFLMPSETGYIKVLNENKISLEEVAMSDLLKPLLLLVHSMPQFTDTKRQTPHTVEEAATFLQNVCENHVHHNSDMKSLAIKAFQSFVRAYSTYPTSLKSIFHVKNLHLGHLAKSFALREAPSHMSGIQVKPAVKRKKHQDRLQPQSKKKRMQEMSEFSGGIVSSSKKRKGKKMKK